VLLYADDILVVARLHYLFDLVKYELKTRDLRLNNAKFVIMRIGRRFNGSCYVTTTICGFEWDGSQQFVTWALLLFRAGVFTAHLTLLTRLFAALFIELLFYASMVLN
jgi:hypothetical protein